MSIPGQPEQRPLEAAGKPGDILAGRFRIEHELGRGGMGEVLLAQDTLLHRQVALKRVRADGGQDAADRRAAVLKEARRASQVNDRRIAAIHDVLDLGDEVLIVMEYVDGETLRVRLDTAMPIDEFWDLSRQCVEALAAAHERGVIHRDIKPENLMLTRSHEIKILDFGIAWRTPRAGSVVGETAATETSELLYRLAGTPLYMAPEAHYGGQIDERTDIFSLGAVFYEMLTTRHPFAAETPERVLDRIMNAAPAPAAELNPAVTPELSRVIDRMLARDPAKRFDSCAGVRAALLAAKRASGAVLTVEETLPMASAGARRPGPGGRRRLWGWAAAAILVATAAIIVWRAVAAPRLPAERRLAVLPPLTPGGTADFAAYAVGATELLANRLLRHQDRPGFQMLTLTDSYDQKLASAGDARRAWGANLALQFTLEERQNRLHARLELLEPRPEPLRERSLGSREVDVPVAEPFAFADSVHHAALALLRLPPSTETAQASLGIRGAGTLRFLLQGLGRRQTAGDEAGRRRAITDLETACRTEPDPAVPRAGLSAAQLRQYAATQDSTWLNLAEATARDAVRLDSSRAEAHRALAWALLNHMRFADAYREFQITSALDPTDDDMWYRWGRAAQRLGDAEEERRIYEAAIARRPHCFKPRWWLASWQYRNGHTDAAERCFREMIQRNPDYFNGYASLGGLLLFRGEYARAVDTLRLAVNLSPNASAYNNLGTAYFNSGRLTEALDAYNQAFQFGDAGYVTWLNLGDAYFWLRDRPDQAREAYRQAVRVGREEMASRAQSGRAPNAMIPASLATALPKLGELDSARVMMREALAIDSLNSRVQYQAALTQWQLGARGDAMTWLRKAVAGGYPVTWIRDSPVHRDWRGDPGFQSLLVSATPAGNSSSPGTGGRQ